MIEGEADALPFGFQLEESGATVFDVAAVVLGECDLGEALAWELFVFRMNIAVLVGVDDDRDFDEQIVLGREGLSFAKLGYGTVAWSGLAFSEVGQLDLVEFEIVLLEAFTPFGDHGGKERPVLVASIHVRFSLVPNDSFEGEWKERRKHAVVASAWIRTSIGGYGTCVTF